MARKTSSKKQDDAPGVLIHKPVEVALAELQFAPYNPRTITRAEMDSLKASIRKHGLVLTLVVQRQSAKYGKLVLIGGHQRVAAVRDLCTEQRCAAPDVAYAVVLDVDDDTAMQLNIALNNIEGDFDPFKLGEIFKAIGPRMQLSDVQATGFTAEQMENLTRLCAPPEELAQQLERDAAALNVGGFASSVTLTVDFDSVVERDEAKGLLRELATDGRKAGSVLMEALRLVQAAPKKRRTARATAPSA
jgi:ParB-like nuclease domain